MKSNRNSTPLRILLVEDDEQDRLFFRRSLQKSGMPCNITECIRAEEALERISGDPFSYDLLVTDYKLPGLSGLELCKKLLKRNLSLPLVLMTGVGSEHLAVQALKAKVDDYIVKDSKGIYLNILPLVLSGLVKKHNERLACKRAEEALRKSEETLRRFMNSATDTFTLWNAELNLIEINEAGMKLFPPGTEKEGIIGKHILDIIPNIKETGRYDKYIEILKIGKPLFIDDIIPHPKFGDIHLTVKAFKVGDGLGMIVTDITERKWLEEALWESEEQYRELADSITDVFFAMDRDLKYTYWNKASEKLTGISAKEAIGKSLYELFPEVEGTAAEKLYLEVLKIKKAQSIENKYQLGNRDYIFELNAYPTKDGCSVFTKDITTRKEAEDELSRRNEFIESIMENLPIGLAVHSIVDGAVRYMNRRFLDICGWPKEDLDNIDEFFDHVFVDPVYRKEVKEKAITYLSIDDPSKMKRENVTITTKNREQKIITHIILPVMHNLVINIIKDTTELKALQAQLIRSERLAATGQLAASIAHEINSPLQAITLMLSDITERCREDNEMMASAGLLKEAYGSIRNTVKNLLELNRPGGQQKQPININIVIQNNLALLNSHLKMNKIKVNLCLSPKLPRIKSSPQHLGQVFLNLITNAVEAISGVSKPKEGLKRRTGKGGEISIRTNLRKGTIVITVSDTGPGIAEEDINSIFDPFYTRKKKMGMGIGLSTCYGIIEEHGGTIGAKNSPDGGAVFTIKLPVG